jgi:hypothetical protein
MSFHEKQLVSHLPRRHSCFAPSFLSCFLYILQHYFIPCVNLFTSTMEPNNWAEFNDANANGVGNSASASGKHAAASTSRNAESVFVSINSSLKALAVLSAGLKNADGADLIELEGDPWKSLPVRTIRPQRENYGEEISRRYESENLLVTANMSRAPKPKQWDKNRMLTWLGDHPISHPTDVQFIQDTVQDRKESAERVNAARQLENDSVDKAEKAWYGPPPMLRLIMALVHSEDIRRTYLKRNDISKKRIALDNQKSVDKRVTTVWELLASLWNDPDFSPVTEHVEDLHSDFTYPISIPHRRVANPRYSRQNPRNFFNNDCHSAAHHLQMDTEWAGRRWS